MRGLLNEIWNEISKGGSHDAEFSLMKFVMLADLIS